MNNEERKLLAKDIFFAIHNEGRGVTSSYFSKEVAVAVITIVANTSPPGSLIRGHWKKVLKELKAIK